jgi:hypothetical protein
MYLRGKCTSMPWDGHSMSATMISPMKYRQENIQAQKIEKHSWDVPRKFRVPGVFSWDENTKS